jgi:hypothetical protein
MPGPTTHVVHSLRLVQLIDRRIHTIAFSPIELHAVDESMVLSKQTCEKVGGDQLLTHKSYFMSFPRSDRR